MSTSNPSNEFSRYGLDMLLLDSGDLFICTGDGAARLKPAQVREMIDWIRVAMPAADVDARQPVPVTEIVRALEREAANTDTDPRWLAATYLRTMTGWETRTLICDIDTRPDVVEYDLRTPEGIAWWDGLTEEERDEWRARVRAMPWWAEMSDRTADQKCTCRYPMPPAHEIGCPAAVNRSLDDQFLRGARTSKKRVAISMTCEQADELRASDEWMALTCKLIGRDWLSDVVEPHRGDNIDPKLAQEAWYHIHGLAVVEPDMPLQKAIQRVYQRCTASSRTDEHG